MAVDGDAAAVQQSNEGHTLYVNNLPEKVSQDGEYTFLSRRMAALQCCVTSMQNHVNWKQGLQCA